MKFGQISSCGKGKEFKDCFTRYKGMLYFWFNTADHSTCVVKAPLDICCKNNAITLMKKDNWNL